MSDDVPVCPHCGLVFDDEEVETAPSEGTCPHCGETVSAISSVCPSCLNPLGD